MIPKILNQEEADKLFHREAMLFELGDGVLASKAAELFGEDAVAFVRKLGTGGECIKQAFPPACDYYIEYLTINGFWHAASYHNLELLRDGAKEKAASSVTSTESGKAEQVLTDAVSASYDTGKGGHLQV